MAGRRTRPNRHLVRGTAAALALGVLLAVLLQSQASALHTSAVEPATSARLERIDPQAYLTQFSDRPHLLLDVRTPQEFASGHIPGAVNISLQTLEAHVSELPTDRPIVIYCRSGNRSAAAGNLLLRRGFAQLYDLGGIIAWQAQGLPIR